MQAEQALDRIAQHAAGAGTMQESAQKTFLADLRRAAARGRHAVEKATAASLAVIGIAVETIEPSKEGDHDA